MQEKTHGMFNFPIAPECSTSLCGRLPFTVYSASLQASLRHMNWLLPEAIPVEHVVLTVGLWSSHSFLFNCLSDILPTTTHKEIVALKLTFFLMFSWIDVKFIHQPLDSIGFLFRQQTKEIKIKHIQISDLSSATTTCTAFLIVFEYI